jgi:hypothetical protein
MRTRLLTAIGLALALMAYALPAYAAAEAEHLRFTGLTVQANFTSTEGCTETIVWVHASDGTVIFEPGGPEAASGGDVSLFQRDVCTDTELRRAYGRTQLTPDQFLIDEEFTTASLAARIDVFDAVSGADIPLDVNITWTGHGDTYNQDEKSHEETPGLKVHFYLDGIFRNGIASGTISDGTTNYSPTLSTEYTYLAAIRVGQTTVIWG